MSLGNGEELLQQLLMAMITWEMAVAHRDSSVYCWISCSNQDQYFWRIIKSFVSVSSDYLESLRKGAAEGFGISGRAASPAPGCSAIHACFSNDGLRKSITMSLSRGCTAPDKARGRWPLVGGQSVWPRGRRRATGRSSLGHIGQSGFKTSGTSRT
jgi:hypothetical protein